MNRFLVFICTLVFVTTSTAQPVASEDPTGLDLDFEFTQAPPRSTTEWYIRNDENYRATFDSGTAYSGKRSFRFDFLKRSPRIIGLTNRSLDPAKILGTTITYTAYIRTKNVEDGEALLWMRVDGKDNQVLAMSSMDNHGATGTSDWKQFKIELPVDKAADNINFGMLHTGTGSAWFDKLEILVDGKPFTKDLIPPVNLLKQREQLASFLEDLQNDPSGLNLDFEKGSNGRPNLWYASRDDQYTSSLDSLIVRSGKYSLRIECIKKDHLIGLGTNTHLDDIKKLRGKQIVYTGYVRTKDVRQGGAGLWMRIDDEDPPLAFNIMRDSATGTTDWQQFRIELQVDPTATGIVFGLMFTGTGTAWFDKLELLVDGKPYSSNPFLSGLLERTRSDTFNLSNHQLDWLKKNVHPVKTAKAGSGFDDLGFLKDMIGDAEIIGLGEATHGTKEFFQMKHRLLEYVASHNPHTIFVLEDNMGEAFSIDRYIHSQDTNSSKKLVQGLYWPWVNKEVQDMIEWMKAFNTSGGKHTIDFRGCDMQSAYTSRVRLMSFLKEYDSTFFNWSQIQFRELVNAINTTAKEGSISVLSGKSFSNDTSLLKHIRFATDVRNYLADKRNEFTKMILKESIAKIIPEAPTIDNIIQDANLLAQTATLYLSGFNFKEFFEYRDTCMAANIRWIQEHSPKDAKIVIWAHNGHVMKNKYMSTYMTMGSHLHKFYGDSYRIFGFKFHEGSYIAVDMGTGLVAHDVRPSYPGTLDWALHLAGYPQYMLDLRKTMKDNTLNGWLHQPLMSKTIGAVATPFHYSPEDISASYDVVIYFDNTTPAEHIDRSSK
jgi:erythromycin esterase